MPRRAQTGLTELSLIQLVRERASAVRGKAVRLGIGDDCAILSPPAGHELLVTTDLSLEGRHFRREWHPAASIGHRALARGLSDIAAMGGQPLAAFLSLAVPKSAANAGFVNGFLDGLMALAAATGTPLAGGDTSEAPDETVLADILLLGSAPKGKALRRSGARAGDQIYVTGALGGASAELAELTANPRKFKDAKTGSDHPHLFPQPRIKVGQMLLKKGLATACLDLSDGLSTDLAHLCRASGVAARVEIAEVPAHPLTMRLGDREQIAAMLHGGEDYELLFTARAGAKVPKSIAGVAITRIGVILDTGDSPTLLSLTDGENLYELKPQGWEHLQ